MSIRFALLLLSVVALAQQVSSAGLRAEVYSLSFAADTGSSTFKVVNAVPTRSESRAAAKLAAEKLSTAAEKLSEAADVTNRAAKAATAAATGDDGSGSESEAEVAVAVATSEAAAANVTAAADMSIKAGEAAAAAAGTSNDAGSGSDSGKDGGGEEENPNGGWTESPNGKGNGAEPTQEEEENPNGPNGGHWAQGNHGDGGVSEAHEGSKKHRSTATAVVEAADGDVAGKVANTTKGLVGKVTGSKVAAKVGAIAAKAAKKALKKAAKTAAKISRKKTKSLNDQYASVQTAAGQTWFPKVHALVLAPAPGSIGYASAVPLARTHDYNGVAPFSVAFGHDYDGASKKGGKSGGGSR